MNKKNETAVKTIFLIALFLFLILCIVTTVFGIVKLLIYGLVEIRVIEVVILLVLYAVISLIAAVLLYYTMRREDK